MKLRETLSRLAELFRRRRLDASSDAEMRFHIDMEIEAGMRRGLSRAEAERDARIRLGSVAGSLDQVRDQRGLRLFHGAASDLRQAVRSLWHQPQYLWIAGGALTAAVAINTLVFTILDGVLLRPLPYPEPDRLARVFESSPESPKFPLSMVQFDQNVRFSRTIESQALYTQGDMQLMHDERAEMMTAVAITPDFFRVLGREPQLGRSFHNSELNYAARVVVLSDRLWTNRFHSDPRIVGQTIRLDRENWTIVGVAAKGLEHVGGDYRSPIQGDSVDIWRPLPMDIRELCKRNCHYTNAIIRTKPGIPWEAAKQELDGILRDLAKQFPDSYQRSTVTIVPLAEEVTRRSSETVWAIAGGGLLVLLFASINVAGLASTRSLARRRELAVRTALGGSRWRLARTILAENVVLAGVAGILGLALAFGMLPAFRALFPQDFPRLHEIVFTWQAALFGVMAAAGTSLAAGLAAALPQSNADPSEALHEDSRSTSGSVRVLRWRGGLIVAQMALACSLCFAAILLLRSSIALGHRDHGFDPEGVITFGMSFPPGTYSDDKIAEFYPEASWRLREIPGVTAAGFSTSLPWTGYDESTYINVPGYTPRKGEVPMARYQAASPGFMEALRRRVERGRFIEATDHAKAPKVVVINRALVDRYFAGGDPIGREMELFGAKRKIIGVVANIQDRPDDASTKPAFWMSLEQVPFSRVQVAVRMDRDRAGVLGAVRAAMASVDRELPLADVRDLSQVAKQATAERELTLVWCLLFTGLAILLAAIGIYALLAYDVRQRRRELGIRLALGASPGVVSRQVIANGFILGVAGAAIGLGISALGGRALAGLLFGIAPTDVVALAAAPLLIVLLAAVACLIPGWSAARTDPVVALRE